MIDWLIEELPWHNLMTTNVLNLTFRQIAPDFVLPQHIYGYQSSLCSDSSPTATNFYVLTYKMQNVWNASVFLLSRSSNKSFIFPVAKHNVQDISMLKKTTIQIQILTFGPHYSIFFIITWWWAWVGEVMRIQLPLLYKARNVWQFLFAELCLGTVNSRYCFFSHDITHRHKI